MNIKPTGSIRFASEGEVVMEISANGITVAGNVTVDGAAKSVLESLDETIKELADAAVRAERARCLAKAVKACEAESLDDTTGTEGDAAYNRAIGHCITAIKEALK